MTQCVNYGEWVKPNDPYFGVIYMRIYSVLCRNSLSYMFWDPLGSV